MCVKKSTLAVIFTILYSLEVKTDTVEKNNEFECFESDLSISCLTSEAAKTIEHSMNKTVSVFGVNLIRNERKINHPLESESRRGFDRMLNALSSFIDTHSFSIDLTASTSLDDREITPRKGGEKGGFFNMNTKAIKREKKYYQYAFMVLLGIFGLTGPLVMQVLGIMAAKSLLAAKAALIIVGGVTLKKLFEKSEDQSPKVKVMTLPLRHDKYESEEDHDRWGYGFNHITYGYNGHGNGVNDPFSGHYDRSTDEKDDYAPIVFGSP